MALKLEQQVCPLINSVLILYQTICKIGRKVLSGRFYFCNCFVCIDICLAFFSHDSTPTEIFEAWGNGLPKLFTFTAQITIIMVTAHALAHTDPVEKVLSKIGNLPNSQVQAYALVTFISGLASLLLVF